MISPIIMWGLVAAMPAVGMEYLYRVLPGAWSEYLYIWVPGGLIISYGVCQMVRYPGTTLIDAFVVWALSTTLMRVVITIGVLGDTVKSGTWVALGLLILARAAQMWWGR
jgi:hypothetical protein